MGQYPPQREEKKLEKRKFGIKYKIESNQTIRKFQIYFPFSNNAILSLNSKKKVQVLEVV